MNNQHAFPTSQIADSDGMTLQDYFAAKAMQAMLGHPNSKVNASPEDYASAAYAVADAMLKERQA